MISSEFQVKETILEFSDFLADLEAEGKPSESLGRINSAIYVSVFLSVLASFICLYSSFLNPPLFW